MKSKNYPCADCVMRRKYETSPRSFFVRLWHWHTKFCPGWKAYFNSLSDSEKEEVRTKYNLK